MSKKTGAAASVPAVAGSETEAVIGAMTYGILERIDQGFAVFG